MASTSMLLELCPGPLIVDQFVQDTNELPKISKRSWCAKVSPKVYVLQQRDVVCALCSLLLDWDRRMWCNVLLRRPSSLIVPIRPYGA